MSTNVKSRPPIEDLREAVIYQQIHGNINFKIRKRPMYVIRGAWHAQAPDTNHDIIGWGLEKLPYIPSILVTENHGCLFFGTPGQCKAVAELYATDVVGFWGTGNGMIPIYKDDLSHCIAVPTKNSNPYPKKWDLDAEHIIDSIDYK